MTGIIILAAGQSSRLGTPKQNLVYQGKTLLQHAVSAAIYSTCRPVIVVLGANSEAILPQIEGHDVQIVYNANWEQGMATSIQTSITELQKTPGISGAIVMLCDQPFVNHELLNNILQKQTETGKGIIASAYNNTIGVPVLFGQKYFAHLLALKGHEGAKKLLAVYTDDIAVVNFAQGAIDIDTITDYEDLVG
jgi:molybdenum cofactor cytidylyltransferase